MDSVTSSKPLNVYTIFDSGVGMKFKLMGADLIFSCIILLNIKNAPENYFVCC